LGGVFGSVTTKLKKGRTGKEQINVENCNLKITGTGKNRQRGWRRPAETLFGKRVNGIPKMRAKGKDHDTIGR